MNEEINRNLTGAGVPGVDVGVGTGVTLGAI